MGGTPLTWLLGVLAAVFLLPNRYEVTIGVPPWATVAVIGFLLWTVIDARATIAAATLLLPLIIASLFIYARGGWDQPETPGSAWFWTLVPATVTLLTAGALGLRHQARIQQSRIIGPASGPHTRQRVERRRRRHGGLPPESDNAGADRDRERRTIRARTRQPSHVPD